MYILIPPPLTFLCKRQHTLYTVTDCAFKKILIHILRAFHINAQYVFILLYSCIVFHLVTLPEFI